MPSTDALAEAYYADVDPQHQDPDAYDEEEYLNLLASAQDLIDNAIGALHNAKEIHETPGIIKVKNLLSEALSRLEEEL